MERRAAFVLLGMLYLAGTLVTVQADIKIKVLTPKDAPMTLECGNRTAGEKFQWFKENVPLHTAVADSEELFELDNDNGTLELLKSTEVLYGNYSCKGSNSSTEYRIVSKPTAHLPDSTSVVEGEKLHLVCAGKQSPGIKVSWTFGDQNYTRSKGRVKLGRDQERGIYGAVLIVENIEMNDRGSVYCRVSYNWSDTAEDHIAEAQTFLRVKDKLAALWPFLGICAEVVVLCAIILIYEKKRNKAELEESDTDQSPDTEPSTKDDRLEYYIPLRGPIPPSDLPVDPPPVVTPPTPETVDEGSDRLNSSSPASTPQRILSAPAQLTLSRYRFATFPLISCRRFWNYAQREYFRSKETRAEPASSLQDIC
ncbi:immunoglobulin domain-containing protein Bsg isoform X2 [Osmia lignaria lignaria]|uniref:immunoglobulin domain-containing protein Bsg isoform X2 n=1 Tax=Osmia lignaria lignaria TaxID=1437193 RepID=UPI00402BB3BD